ncbi:hypothetical protein AVEN_133790-1 [Araneus ventricosus]|uniref:Uncharacterized protein n=1 Tax=Araneus ventricosus TaxID=182803 RepID=A0A4Y2L183_ARAVE|nr:hypothetical protein AVEN_133790-1 [Araneus ventricosus]
MTEGFVFQNQAIDVGAKRTVLLMRPLLLSGSEFPVYHDFLFLWFSSKLSSDLSCFIMIFPGSLVYSCDILVPPLSHSCDHLVLLQAILNSSVYLNSPSLWVSKY